MTLRRKMNWRPGQHAYVILPTVSGMPSEAHPFTIASIPQSLNGHDDNAEKDVVFLIRGRTGFTGRLREFASRNGICRVPAFVDGPYGCPPNLSNFSTCILVAGEFPLSPPFARVGLTDHDVLRRFGRVIHSSAPLGSRPVCVITRLRGIMLCKLIRTFA